MAAILVCLDFGDPAYAQDVEEVVRLVESAGVTRHQLVRGRRSRPDPKFYAGVGKVGEIARAAAELNAMHVVFNHELSAAQERNLERELQRRVMDRTELILEIFAQRAQTTEGKLQVELARLEHLSTRLVRGWTHLERQRGGLGKTGGPGETQLELDRRYIARRVRVLKEKLQGLKNRRQLQRRARVRRDVLSISIAGYTNAGKSTLFNALAHAKAYEADQLFATLDTTTRRLWLPEAGPVVVSDTVGFIRSLPHSLVAAFRATLEETVRADLLLHVVDAASAARAEQAAEVDKVLGEIGADAVPKIAVWNKIDCAHLEPAVERDQYGKISRVLVSARTGAGLEGLRGAIAEFARDRAAARGAAPSEPLSVHHTH
ncbi:MAG: GTPase HflX [Betaproteobacteria bacterium 13_1_20CM_67_22]|nr:MAG: GTPase HflX [Betaproteobacteria bacterium 13_1_20CM_67_22]